LNGARFDGAYLAGIDIEPTELLSSNVSFNGANFEDLKASPTDLEPDALFEEP